MKKLSILALCLGLTGCASTDYSKFTMSSATVENFQFKESTLLKKRKHKIDVSFEYNIKNYNDIEGLYFCTVQFNLTNHNTMTAFKNGKQPCLLNQASGEVSIKWPSPLDHSLNASKEQLTILKYPIEFFVAIHQKTTKRTSEIIGKSKVNVSAI